MSDYLQHVEVKIDLKYLVFEHGIENLLGDIFEASTKKQQK